MVVANAKKTDNRTRWKAGLLDVGRSSCICLPRFFSDQDGTPLFKAFVRKLLLL